MVTCDVTRTIKWRFYIPPHKKRRGIMLYPPKILTFWVSVHPSVQAHNRVLCDTLSLGLGDYCHVRFIHNHFVRTKLFYVAGHFFKKKNSHLTSSYAYKKSHNIQFVRLSLSDGTDVCPSVSASFPDTNLSSFWPIFFKLRMDIDIGEEWFGIAKGLNSFINNRVMTLDWCKNVVSGLVTWVVFDRFSSNFAWTLISGRSGLGLQMG